jgi:hypothetical protein
MAAGVLRQQPALFFGAILDALAEATIDLMSGGAHDPRHIKQLGFAAFWGAIANT